MKNLKLSQISNVYLSELITLMNRIEGEIETFAHVSDYLPKSLRDELTAFDKKLTTEHQERENEF